MANVPNVDRLLENVERLEGITKKIEKLLKEKAENKGFDADLAQYTDGHYILADLYAALVTAQAAVLGRMH